MFPTRRITLGGDVFRDEHSVEFDGTNDYVDCGSSSSLDVGTSDFSFSSWFKLSTKGGSGYHNIVAKGNTLSDGLGWGITLLESDGRIFFDTDGDVARQSAETSTSSWDFGKWYHLAGTRSNSNNTLKLYLDGVLVGTNASATNNDLGDASENFKIGSSKDDRFAQGNISDVAYYNTVLSASQVATIYNGREPYNHKEGVASSSLVSWWRMGDGALDSLVNKSGLICDATNATLGSNLVSEGTFDGADDGNPWVTGTGWDVNDGSSGVADCDGLQDDDTILRQNSILTIGKVYKLTFDYTCSAGGLSIYYGNTLTQAALTSSDDGFLTYFGIQTGTTDLRFQGNSTFAGTIDNVVMQEVGGNGGVMINMDAVDITGDTP